MIRPSDGAREGAQRWRVALEFTPRGGSAGERLGRGVGTSMEFHDRRAYAPGDDVRHIDWRVMARTDEVQVRVHQEEVVPRLDVLLDGSASMGLEPEKAQGALDLAWWLAEAGRGAGVDVRLIELGDRVERRPMADVEARGVAFDSVRDFSDLLTEAAGQLRPRSQRVLISDFLVEADPAAIVRTAARGGGPSAFLQVLSAFDADPTPEGASRLTDAETGGALDLVVDRASIARYRERLGRLTAGLDEEARRLGGASATLVPARLGGIGAMLEALGGAGIAAPA